MDEYAEPRTINKIAMDISEYFGQRSHELRPNNGNHVVLYGPSDKGTRLEYGEHVINVSVVTEEFRPMPRAIALDVTFDKTQIGRITARHGIPNINSVDETGPTPQQRADEKIKAGQWPAEKRAELVIRELLNPSVDKLIALARSAAGL